LLLLAACSSRAGRQPDAEAGVDGAPASDASEDAGSSPDADSGLRADPLPWSTESTDPACSNGVDDDHNGYVDCDDFACSRNPSVWVCDSSAAYESSPAACSDGKDNDGDGLIDCADPDCAKNPFHSVCPKPASETAASCSAMVDADGDGLSGCADDDCVLIGACPRNGRTLVLFDQTLDETAAFGPNSDWLLDGSNRRPVPSNPAREDDWAGDLSSFGFQLHAQGDLVESLPAWDGGRLSFGDATNPLDLSTVDVLVLAEPSRAIRPEEAQAVVAFVRAGGGLLMLANHLDSDRDSNGVSAPQALDALIDATQDPFGFRYDLLNDAYDGTLSRVEQTSHPVVAGVHSIGYHVGTHAHLTGSSTRALGLVFAHGSSVSSSTVGIVVGVSGAGRGRVVFMTDSAILDDGSDSHGDRVPAHDSWHQAGQDNATLLLNAVRWLAKKS
jgi:hypothetical protein